MTTDELIQRVAREERHGLYKSELKTYKVWSQMKSRCLNPNHDKYYRYGARGIRVCDRWLNSFSAFLSDMGRKPDGKTLDRRDNDGNYEPLNCRWATPAEQSNNTRRCRYYTIDGETKTIMQWVKDPRCSISHSALKGRLDSGMPPREAILRPKMPTRTKALRAIVDAGE